MPVVLSPPTRGPLRFLFLVAAGLGLVSIAVPHDPATSEAGVVAVAALSALTAAAMSVLDERLEDRVLSLLLCLGTLYVSAAILLSAGVPNAGAALYLWIAVYAAYALPRGRALAHVAFLAACYGAIIAIDPPGYPPYANWTTMVGSILCAALLVGEIRRRLDAVITHLERTVRRDPLTGLLNRRGFEEALGAELARAQRSGRPLALLVADADHFKSINDRHGHEIGDLVLRKLAELLRDGIRSSDSAARIGGEEFAVLLPETDLDEALELAERLRMAVATANGQGPPITASFGIAIAPDDAATGTALLRCADRALYDAKRAGRDRCERYVELAAAPV